METLIKDLNESLIKSNVLIKRLEKERASCALEKRKNTHQSKNLNIRAKEIIRLEIKHKRINSLEILEADVKLDRQKVREAELLNEKTKKELQVRENMLNCEHKDRMKVANDKVAKYVKEYNDLQKAKKEYKEDIQKKIDIQLQARGIKL